MLSAKRVPGRSRNQEVISLPVRENHSPHSVFEGKIPGGGCWGEGMATLGSPVGVGGCADSVT